ncbi:MAG: DUF4924 family protein [Alistipes sp.]|jgi:hypothetical protein|nr:DUF4924 family protein [Alistipes sp.]
MLIALQKRKENIAEYILYLWQVEDLLRALQFSPEAIYTTLVAKTEGLDEQQKENVFNWYMQIVELLQKEGKESKGHIEHTLHLIADMHNLHLQLMKLPVGEHYRMTYRALEAELPRLRMVLGDSDMRDISDTELCFRALYATLLYRIKGGGESVISDTLAVISPAIGELAAMYGKVERGEINLFDD